LNLEKAPRTIFWILQKNVSCACLANTSFLPYLGPYHNRLENFENFVFHSKNASNVFLHPPPEKFGNAAIIGHYGIVLEEKSHKEIT